MSSRDEVYVDDALITALRMVSDILETIMLCIVEGSQNINIQDLINATDGSHVNGIITSTVSDKDLDVRIFSNATNYSLTTEGPEFTMQEYDAVDQSRNIVKIIQRVIIPLICAFGLLANLLNLVIFGRRLCSNAINSIERGAVISLAGLAVSDLLFCLVTCLGSIMRTHRVVFMEYDLEYFYQMYSGIFKNMFIKSSTWLTMIAAISRYAAVCYPLWARQFIRVARIKMAILTCFAFSFLLHIPLIWTHDIKDLACGNQSVKMFDSGVFLTNKALNRCFTYIWTFLGFIVPISVLAYCNTVLIVSFKKSMQMRTQLRRHQSKASVISDRFTVTLIAVVILFLLLITPSEVLHLYEMITMPTSTVAFEVALVSMKNIKGTIWVPATSHANI